MRSDCQWYQLSLWGEHILTLIAMVAQLLEYTRNHQIVQFTWVSYMVCGLYLNKAVIKYTCVCKHTHTHTHAPYVV